MGQVEGENTLSPPPHASWDALVGGCVDALGPAEAAVWCMHQWQRGQQAFGACGLY